jgi:HlyD family secretion protein
MKNHWRRSLATALALTVAVASCARATSGSATQETVPIQRGSLTATVGATGTVRPEQIALLTFKTSGTVGEVRVQEGSQVRAGDVLAVLADESLPSTVILARADLAAAEKALDDLKASTLPLAQAQSALAEAQDALDKAQRRYTYNQEGNRATSDTIKAAKAKLAVARERMDAAKSAYDHSRGNLSDGGGKAQAWLAYTNAKQAYNTALAGYNWYVGHPSDIEQAKLEADVAVAQAQVDDAQREVERLKDGPDASDLAAAEARVAAARASMEQAFITAPFSGTVTSVEVQAGDQVAPGTEGFQLVDLSKMLVDVDVSEVDINRVKQGQPATMTFDAVPDKTYHGTIEEVATVGETVQGVVNFNVTVALEDDDADVRPGLTAAANLVVDQLENVLLVPNRAVRVRDGDRVVYVLKDGVITPVTVVLGTSSDTDSQVLSGDVAEGDQVVLNPPATLGQFGPQGGGGGGFFNRQ